MDVAPRPAAAGVTLLGWRAQPPTQYAALSHLTPYGHHSSRQKRAAAPQQRPLLLPRDHRFRRATRLHYTHRVPDQRAQRAVADRGLRPVSSQARLVERARVSSARALRPLQGRVPTAAAVAVGTRPAATNSPPQRKPPPEIPRPPQPPQPPQPPPTLIGGRVPSVQLAPLSFEPRQPTDRVPTSGTDSPRCSILSRGSTPRALGTPRQRVRIVDKPFVSSAPSPSSSLRGAPAVNAEPIKLAALRDAALPSSLSVNSQWGPQKTITVPGAQQVTSSMISILFSMVSISFSMEPITFRIVLPKPLDSVGDISGIACDYSSERLHFPVRNQIQPAERSIRRARGLTASAADEKIYAGRPTLSGRC